MFRIIFHRNKLKIKQKKLNCYQKFSGNTDDSRQPRDLSERINIKNISLCGFLLSRVSDILL